MFKLTVKRDGEKIKKAKGDNVILVSIDDNGDKIEVDGFVAGDPELLIQGVCSITKEIINEAL